MTTYFSYKFTFYLFLCTCMEQDRRTHEHLNLQTFAICAYAMHLCIPFIQVLGFGFGFRPSHCSVPHPSLPFPQAAENNPAYRLTCLLSPPRHGIWQQCVLAGFGSLRQVRQDRQNRRVDRGSGILGKPSFAWAGISLFPSSGGLGSLHTPACLPAFLASTADRRTGGLGDLEGDQDKDRQ